MYSSVHWMPSADDASLALGENRVPFWLNFAADLELNVSIVLLF